MNNMVFNTKGWQIVHVTLNSLRHSLTGDYRQFK